MFINKRVHRSIGYYLSRLACHLLPWYQSPPGSGLSVRLKELLPFICLLINLIGLEMACLNPFQKFRGFNDWKRKKHAAPRLQAEELSAHATALFSLVEKPYTSGWEGFRDDLERLSEA